MGSVTRATQLADAYSHWFDSPTKASNFARLVSGSLAEQTWRGYLLSFQQFESFCSAAGRCALPADPVTVANYVEDRWHNPNLGDVGHHLAAIRRYHVDLGYANPCAHPFVKAAASGFRRLKRLNRANEPGPGPLCRTHLRMDDVHDILVRGFHSSDPSIVLSCAAIVFAVLALTRASTLVHVLLGDVQLGDNHLLITLRFLKARDVLKPPHSFTIPDVPVGVTAPPSPAPRLITPNALIRRAIRVRLRQGAKPSDPLFFSSEDFPRFSPSSPSQHVSTHLLRALHAIDAPPAPVGSCFAPHSARHCARYALSCGATETDVMQLGAWASLLSMERYVKDTPPSCPSAYLFFGHLLRGAARAHALAHPVTARISPHEH